MYYLHYECMWSHFGFSRIFQRWTSVARPTPMLRFYILSEIVEAENDMLGLSSSWQEQKVWNKSPPENSGSSL